jgi:hypothetical protein
MKGKAMDKKQIFQIAVGLVIIFILIFLIYVKITDLFPSSPGQFKSIKMESPA